MRATILLDTDVLSFLLKRDTRAYRYQPHAWIAATALRFGIPLLTHNGSDFEDIAGLTVITETGVR